MTNFSHQKRHPADPRKKYYEPFLNSGKKILLLGIGFIEKPPGYQVETMLRINLEERYKDMQVMVSEQIKKVINKMFKINDLLTSKQELFNISVKQGETWITEMSNAELKNLVKLGG